MCFFDVGGMAPFTLYLRHLFQTEECSISLHSEIDARDGDAEGGRVGYGQYQNAGRAPSLVRYIFG